jgi:hypothetical protein
VIRRLLLAATMLVAASIGLSSPAGAAANVACAWNEIPLHTGVCLAL